jgi:6-phosphogluconolactonase/glucosamine-6-phosphate isomerase/deaminase
VSKKTNENFQRISLNLNFLKKIKKIILVINNKNKKIILNKLLNNSRKKNKTPVFKLLEIASKKICLYYIKH